MAFVDELRSLGGPRLTLVPQDEQGLPDIAGFLARTGLVYCCGPPGLIQAVQQHCSALGLANSLHIERFGPAGTPEPTGQDSAIEVELRRTGKRVSVPPGSSILKAVRGILPTYPSSCEEGYCGTCEARVLAGVPEHRDSVLSSEERAANDCMMICVSRATTPTLALDL